MPIALPTYKPEDAMRKVMLPLIPAEHVEAFHRSYFVSEYWLKWYKGAPKRPGFTPFGLEAHEGELLRATENYARGVWRKAIDAIIANQREFEMNDVRAITIGLPDDLLQLTRDLWVAPFGTLTPFGLRLVGCVHFAKHGVIFSAPEFGRYMAFPERKEYGSKEEVEEETTQAGGEVSACSQ